MEAAEDGLYPRVLGLEPPCEGHAVAEGGRGARKADDVRACRAADYLRVRVEIGLVVVHVEPALEVLLAVSGDVGKPYGLPDVEIPGLYQSDLHCLSFVSRLKYFIRYPLSTRYVFPGSNAPLDGWA